MRKRQSEKEMDFASFVAFKRKMDDIYPFSVRYYTFLLLEKG